MQHSRYEKESPPPPSSGGGRNGNFRKETGRSGNSPSELEAVPFGTKCRQVVVLTEREWWRPQGG